MQRRCDRNDNGLSADEFNEHYAGISTDAGYESSCLKATVHDGEDIVSESSVFYLLDHLHHTTTGYDQLPAWFLRLTAPVHAGIIARLINLSVAHAHIPMQWKTSIILPIPKIQQPVTPIELQVCLPANWLHYCSPNLDHPLQSTSSPLPVHNSPLLSSSMNP